MTQPFRGKVAFVTGAGSGIGEAVVYALANAGCRVVVADIDPEAAERVADEIGREAGQAIAMALDVADRSAFDAAAATLESTFGRLDILVNNAGVAAGPTPFHETPLPDLEWVFGVNVFGVFNGVKSLLPLMLKHGDGGYIVNTCSAAGFVVTPRTDQNSGAAYSASKHALVAMTEAWRLSLGPLGIRVILLVPGAVRTGFAGAVERHLQAGGDEHNSDLAAGLKEALEAGADPGQIAERVVRGLINDEAFIFTSSTTRDLIVRRHEELLAAFDA